MLLRWLPGRRPGMEPIVSRLGMGKYKGHLLWIYIIRKGGGKI